MAKKASVTRMSVAVAAAAPTLQDADKAFARKAAEVSAGVSRVKAATWGAIGALADVYRAATAAGSDVKAVWKHMADLCQTAGVVKQARSEWTRAAAGMATGMQPAADESLEAFAKRCPANPNRASGTGERDKGDTPAKRAKAFGSALGYLGNARERLTVAGAPPQLLKKLDALTAEVKAAEAAEAEAAEAAKALKA